MSSLEDAVQLEVSLPIDLDILIVHVDTYSDDKQLEMLKIDHAKNLTLGEQDTFVDVGQASRQERAELDEVVDCDALFLCFTSGSILLL